MEEDKRPFLQIPNQGDAVGGDKVAGDKFEGDKVGGNKVEVSVLLQEEIFNLEKRIKKLEDTQQKHSSFDKRIEKLEKKSDKQEKTCWINKMPAWGWILIASIGGAIIFITAMLLLQRCLGFEVSYENSATIILAFVGIAATFVVVSNYAQVKEIEGRFDRKIEELNVSNKKYIDKYKHEAIGVALLNMAESFFSIEQHVNALLLFIKALAELYEENPSHNDIDFCFNRIDLVILKINETIELSIPLEQKRNYLNLLYKIDNNRTSNVINFFNESIKWV